MYSENDFISIITETIKDFKLSPTEPYSSKLSQLDLSFKKLIFGICKAEHILEQNKSKFEVNRIKLANIKEECKENESVVHDRFRLAINNYFQIQK